MSAGGETFMSESDAKNQTAVNSLDSLRSYVEGKSIGEVAHAVGYDSAAAFGTAFKQCFGVTPSGYMSG